MPQQFHDGDIVRHPDHPRTRFRLSNVKRSESGAYSTASFTPVKKDGTRDRRWDVGFSGALIGYTLIERQEQHEG